MKKLTAQIKIGDVVLPIHKSIVSISFGALDRANLSDVTSWGIMANTGEISFIDKDSSFKSVFQQVNSGEIDVAQIEATIFASNKAHDKRLAVFDVNDIKYDHETQLVEISLQDKLLRWQNIQIPYFFPFSETSLLTIVETILAEYTEVGGAAMSAEAAYRLHSINIYCPRSINQSLWSVMTSICQVSGCRIFSYENGFPYISYYPNKETPIVIMPNSILSIDNEIGRVETKMEAVSIDATVRTKYTNTNIGSTNVQLYSQPKFGEVYFVGNQASPSTVVEYQTDAGLYGVRVTVPIVPSHEIIYSTNHLVVTGTEWRLVSTGPSENPRQKDIVTLFNYISWEYYKPDNSSFYVRFDIPDANQFAISTTVQRTITDVQVSVDADFYIDGHTNTYSSNTAANRTILETNEYMQTNNTIDGENHAQTLVNEIASRYSNGVYCCEIECLMIDYYDTEGNLVIDSTRENDGIQSFQRNQVVVPYVIRNGVLQPYRTDAEGNALTFVIAGIRYSYKGFIRQTLQLVEYTTIN